MSSNQRSAWGAAFLSGMVAASLLFAMPLQAQDADRGGDTGYRTREDTPVNREDFSLQNLDADEQAKDAKTAGPVRMARFAALSGSVNWRADNSQDWSAATVNLPLRQGAEIWIKDGGRAAIQFDDGSELRLGNGALVILKLLYSDAEGEFSQITLNDGLATLHSRHDNSVYQIDTPIVSVKSKGVSQIRFGSANGSEVAVQQGSATVEGKQGKITLAQNDFLSLATAETPYEIRRLPAEDSWDRWNAEQNRRLETKTETSRHVPPNIGLVSGELDSYGSWREDPSYGWVWSPRSTSSDWRPYQYGHWTWVEPFGWTWVSDEPWGWAPYHYGTWVNRSYGWAWCPGPVYQYWSPAVVHFSVYAGNVAWAPLCPWEVRYPSSFSIGYFNRNWAFSFSIGCAGVYYPYNSGYCVGRSFNSHFINHFSRFDHFESRGHSSFAANVLNHNTPIRGHNFVPFNASHAAGTTLAGANVFGGRGRYQPATRSDASFFTKGESFGAPAAGHRPVSGPSSVQPTHLAMTPSRTFESGLRAPTQRGGYSAALPANVQRNLSGAASSPRQNIAPGAHSQTAAGTPNRLPDSPSSRSRPVFDGRTSSSGNSSHGTGSSGLSPSEAARQARSSVGYTGHGTSAGQGSGVPRDSGRSGGSRSDGLSRSNGGYTGGNYGGSQSGGGSYGGNRSGGGGYSGGYGDRSQGTTGRSGGNSGPTYSPGGSGSSPYSGGSSRSPAQDRSGTSGGYRGGSSGGNYGGSQSGGGSYGGNRSGGGGYSGGRSSGGYNDGRSGSIGGGRSGGERGR